MKATLLIPILALIAFASLPGRLLADEEQDCIAKLQSSATAQQKWAACQRLRAIGTAKAVPALAQLLTQDGLSQAARYVLEVLPAAEADAALAEALNNTSGLLKSGVIESIGWRGKAQSTPLLAKLLNDSDSNVACSAAIALGRIGGTEAVAALSAARNRAAGVVQTAIIESLLKCADRLAGGSDSGRATAIYKELVDSGYSPQIRAAAWRGLALADSAHRPRMIVQALKGTDREIGRVALTLIRESADPRSLQACAGEWNSVGPDAQLAILDAEVKFNPKNAASFARTGSHSQDARLRIAALRALGELNVVSSVAEIAKAAAGPDAVERDAARESLARLRGPAANQALLEQTERVAPAEKAELLRALGERGDNSATPLLVKNASSKDPKVRQAALQGLAAVGSPDSARPLLEMASKADTDADREPILSTLFAVCDAVPDKDALSRKLVPVLTGLPAAQRRELLPLLSVLGTTDALSTAQEAVSSSDAELAKQGVRVLSQWPNSAPAEALLGVARSNPDATMQTLALRGSIQVAALETDPAKRMVLLREAMSQAKRVEEKKQVLAQLEQVATPEALDIALNELGEPYLAKEAALAGVSIAEKLAATHPDIAALGASKLLASVHDNAIVSRAWALRRKPDLTAPFIRDWLVCGPFSRAGLVGATALFDVPFAPEQPGSTPAWKTVPASDHVNLAAVFPGQDNCAAYLKTTIIAPDDQNALLLIGSDDGVKAWLNGKVIHSNNVDRGEIPDQDIAPVSLRKGRNELLLKITQGGGGWGACARIVDPDFKAIPGLSAEASDSQ
ncbi:MAG TPA: HEAT repeat domain-containing protein [Verrucomicrobiae bacterium]|nr:HEAT repeat domain-containing protein [Verrucomicrobiae bacterium]